MKVCVISTSVFKVPASGYSGLEQLAWLQAKGLAEKGHEVALIAPDGSTCPNVTIIPTGPEGQWDEKHTYSKYWQYLPHFDVICDSSWAKWAYNLKAEGVLKAPVLGWMHAPVNTMIQSLPPVEKPCFVCISKDQASHFEALFNYTPRVCYNGCFDGSTLLSLVSGKRESIGSYVARSGREPVLGWCANTNKFKFVGVEKTLTFPPTNDHMVEIKVSGIPELTLLSTPDNPIMTREGWKAANAITCRDEVLCGEEAGSLLDERRNSVCSETLRKEETSGDFRTPQSSNVFNLQHCIEGQPEKDAHICAGGMDGGRGCCSKKDVPKIVLRGHVEGHPESYQISDQGTSGSKRIQEASGIVTQEEESIIREVDEHPTNRCGVFSRTDRWGGAHIYEHGQEKIHSFPGARDSKLGYADHQLREEVASGNGVVGSPGEQRTEDSQSPCMSSCSYKWIDSGEGAGKNHTLHDCKETQSRIVDGVLPVVARTGMEIEVFRTTDRNSSTNQESQLSSWKKVASVRRVSNPDRVFDLKTSTGNFIANGIVVHNCDLNLYKPMNLHRNKRYLFLARFSTIKGPDLCIEACQQAGASLDLVGDTSITNEPEYLKHCQNATDEVNAKQVHAFVSGQLNNYRPNTQIRMVGPASRGQCVWWMSQAHAMLHLNQRFREPYGLAPVEAMACQTPVIAWRFGAMKETVLHGETGFLVSSLAEAVHLIKEDAVSTIKRERCREWASQFSVGNMIDRVESLCIEAIETGGW